MIILNIIYFSLSLDGPILKQIFERLAGVSKTILQERHLQNPAGRQK